MPDFTAPEYASYVQFMREHPQEREFRDGDWFWQQEYDVVLQPPEIGCYGCSELDPYHTQEMVWLPQLADWREMLEAAGERRLTVDHDVTDGSYTAHVVFDYHRGPTPEEAAAKLWLAVTGRSA